MPRTTNNYLPKLLRFLNFLDDGIYDSENPIPADRLASLTPGDVRSFFFHIGFGVSEDEVDDDTHAISRESNLEYYKKAISSFMPNRLMQWNELTQHGNPTRAAVVLEVIKLVRKKCGRGQGPASSARNSIKVDEFRNVITILRERTSSLVHCIGIPAFLAFQFSMIARIDDTTKWFSKHLKVHDRYPSIALKARLNWTKNCTEEREAPWQTLLASMDTKFCVFLNVGLWLEASLEVEPGHMLSPYIFSFSNDYNVPTGAEKTNAKVGRILNRLFKDHFGDLHDDRNFGSHSIRKFGGSYARARVHKDDRDCRGRFRNKRVSDIYEDVELPYADTNTCAALCVGGPCCYKLKDGGVDDAFILQHVTPRIEQKFGSGVALVLGKALLWLIFSSESEIVPELIGGRVKQAYELLDTELEEGENPVEKKLLFISVHEEHAVLTEVDGTQGDGVAVGGADVAGPAQSTNDLLRGLMAQMVQQRHEIGQIEMRREQDRAIVLNRLQEVVVQSQQAVVVANQNGGLLGGGGGQPVPLPAFTAAPGAPEATLSPSPRNLHVLWEEWVTGVGGRKAARLFTAQERGRNKHKFHRRKVVWDQISTMINAGYSSPAAIEAIYSAYGHGSTVTTIINRLKEDKRNGELHPNLVV